MKLEVREEFLKHLVGIDEALCLGYGLYLSDVSVGMEFIISPLEVWRNSTDAFTLQNAFSNYDWKIRNTIFHYSDVHKVLKIQKNRTRKQLPVFRVKNLRTNVDFDLFKDNDRLEENDTIHLFFIK